MREELKGGARPTHGLRRDPGVEQGGIRAVGLVVDGELTAGDPGGHLRVRRHAENSNYLVGFRRKIEIRKEEIRDSLPVDEHINQVELLDEGDNWGFLDPIGSSTELFELALVFLVIGGDYGRVNSDPVLFVDGVPEDLRVDADDLVRLVEPDEEKFREKGVAEAEEKVDDSLVGSVVLDPEFVALLREVPELEAEIGQLELVGVPEALREVELDADGVELSLLVAEGDLVELSLADVIAEVAPLVRLVVVVRGAAETGVRDVAVLVDAGRALRVVLAGLAVLRAGVAVRVIRILVEPFAAGAEWGDAELVDAFKAALRVVAVLAAVAALDAVRVEEILVVPPVTVALAGVEEAVHALARLAGVKRDTGGALIETGGAELGEVLG